MGKYELLVYGLIVLGFLLFNNLMQAVKRARQQQEEEWAQQQRAAPPPDDEPLEYIWGPRPQTDLPAAAAHLKPAPRVEAIAARPAAPSRPAAPRELFRSRQDLRHAVVVMTVLGPCRALEPHDRREGGPAPGSAAPDRS
jgi:hypothetical protein